MSSSKKKTPEEIHEYEEIKKRIGRRIKSQRNFINLTQEEAAKKAGLELKQFRNMEYGVSFSLPDFLRIAAALRANPADLLKENDETK